MTETNIHAALLVIGDEILSGRTKDKNIGYIAEYMTNIGVDVREVRVVPDVEEEIVSTLNHLRNRYTYVFTTGGIGPTHDDITADAVAKAFGVAIDEDPRAIALLRETRRALADEITGRVRDERFRRAVGAFEVMDEADGLAAFHGRTEVQQHFKNAGLGHEQVVFAMQRLREDHRRLAELVVDIEIIKGYVEPVVERLAEGAGGAA